MIKGYIEGFHVIPVFYPSVIAHYVDEPDPRSESEPLETLVWTPSHGLTDRQIDQFLVISR